MSSFITCPVCEFEFLAETDSKGLCECPSCSSVLAVNPSMEERDFVTEFEDCTVEAWTINEEVKMLDDQSLEDEIGEAVAVKDFIEGTFSIFTDMQHFNKMTPASRKLAEGVYLLIHSNKYFGYDH